VVESIIKSIKEAEEKAKEIVDLARKKNLK